MTEHRETRVALRRHPLLRRPIVWFWALVTCYWALVWRTPVWDIDDLYFATRSGTPGGRIDWADFARLTVYDLVERNGRFSDMMVQLAMAMGDGFAFPSYSRLCRRRWHYSSWCEPSFEIYGQ